MTDKTNHAELKKWVEEMAAMCSPDQIYWCDGSEEEVARLKNEAFKTGELVELDQEKLPGCVYHQTAKNDVARTENLTFICTDKEEDASPINNWKSREDGYAEGREFFKDSMVGRTMYVIPFSMGTAGSPFAKYGIELTDSIYVVYNMVLMTEVGTKILDILGEDGEYTKCLHSKAQLNLDRRRILHFPEDNTIWSVNSGYGGNVLLGKKCLALRIASFLGKNEGWMAEHMLIMGVESPDGKIEYVAGAFPSACGKTNMAMLVPPEGLKAKGYKIWTVGDDIAWLRIGDDGRLWAINPEAGCFGVAPGTSTKTNPNMMEAIKEGTIFTNVVLKDDKTVWWEGHDDPPPKSAQAWTGDRWSPDMKDENGKPVPGANPNSRFTVPMSNVPTLPKQLDLSNGVPISAFLFGGRRARLAPLVYETFDWQHGTFVASSLASEGTAAQYEGIGQVRRDPMAMRPFVGYNMADYFRFWLEIGKKIKNPPRIYHVNWFRLTKENKFLWPGFGENLRVIEWVLRRCRGEADAVETPIGYLPNPDDIDLTGIKVPAKDMEALCEVIPDDWKAEADGVEEFYKSLGDKMPAELMDELKKLRERLDK